MRRLLTSNVSEIHSSGTEKELHMLCRSEQRQPYTLMLH